MSSRPNATRLVRPDLQGAAPLQGAQDPDRGHARCAGRLLALDHSIKPRRIAQSAQGPTAGTPVIDSLSESGGLGEPPGAARLRCARLDPIGRCRDDPLGRPAGEPVRSTVARARRGGAEPAELRAGPAAVDPRFGARSPFGIRGVRLIVDGIPATMPDGQGQAATISLPSTSRIEVLRGPLAALLYGNVLPVGWCRRSRPMARSRRPGRAGRWARSEPSDSA